MKKYLLSLLILCTFILLSADYKKELYDLAFSEIANVLQEKADSSSVIIYGEFMGNDGENFLTFMLSELSHKKKYHFVNRNDMKKLFYEQIMLSDPIYEEKNERVSFKKPQWVLEGESNYFHKKVLGKNKYYLEIDFTLSNIKTGTNDIIFHNSYTKFWQPPLIYSILLTILVIITCRVIVQRFKGYYNYLVYSVGAVLLIIYYIWLQL